MRYHSNAELPRPVREHLPKRAQDIFREAFNSMMEPYGSEESALCVAWEVVERDYEKGADGRWHRKQKEPRRD